MEGGEGGGRGNGGEAVILLGGGWVYCIDVSYFIGVGEYRQFLSGGGGGGGGR